MQPHVAPAVGAHNNNLFANAHQALLNKLFLSAQKLQVFNSSMGTKELAFIREVLTVHLCVKAILLRGVNFPNPEDLLNLILQLKNSELVSLQIEDTLLPESDVLCLAAVIQETKLKGLELANTSISDRGATALASALHHCYNLHTLNLSRNQVGSLGALAIARKLSNSSISVLNLGGNPIGPEAMCEFAKHLPLASLKQLKLNNVGMGDQGFLALCNVLPQCHGLEVLEISSNELSQASAQALALVLNQCVSLRHVNLSLNQLSSLAPFNQVLASNMVLESLDVHGNHRIEDESVKEFMENVLTWHVSLSKIELKGTRVTSYTLAMLQSKLQRLHDSRSIVLCTLISALKVKRLGWRSSFARYMPFELLRILGDML
ncbi:hypothetical protein BASA81_016509 [Batrachochytrium salamandrivorans]|nr:hypothetical protein BASA81_016509 [Batrachochytrium salamandrivorans]